MQVPRTKEMLLSFTLKTDLKKKIWNRYYQPVKWKLQTIVQQFWIHVGELENESWKWDTRKYNLIKICNPRDIFFTAARKS